MSAAATTLTAGQINQAIITGVFTADEVRSFYDAYKFAAAKLTRNNKFRFGRGTKVKFTGRSGNVIQGVIVDVKVKNMIVLADNTRWRVPASMLTEV